MRVLLVVALGLLLSGCGALDLAIEVSDIFVDEPTPVCDADSVGAQHEGQQCLKFSDDTYRWEAMQ